MGTIYQFNHLCKIEFQLDQYDVLMNIEMIQNSKINKTSFLISHTELNKILSNIQFYNPQFEINDLLKITNLNEEVFIYSLDFTGKELNSNWISEYQFASSYKEIRA